MQSRSINTRGHSLRALKNISCTACSLDMINDMVMTSLAKLISSKDFIIL